MKKAVFSLSSSLELDHALILHKSLEKYALNFDLFHLYIGSPEKYERVKAAMPASVNVVTVDRLPIKHGNWKNLAFQYDLNEFSICLKPFVFDYLFRQGYQAIYFLDPHIEIYAPLKELEDFLDQYEAILQPHIDHPLPLDGFSPTNEEILNNGPYSSHFIGLKLSDESSQFLTFWKNCSATTCLKKIGTQDDCIDHRWISFIPSFVAKTKILRDSTQMLSVWNLSQNEMIQTSGEPYNTSKGPLVCFNFAHIHEEDYLHGSRTSLKELNSPLNYLIKSHRERLIKNRKNLEHFQKYELNYFSDGSLIDPEDRVYYFHMHDEQKKDLKNPFDQKEFFINSKNKDPLYKIKLIKEIELQLYRPLFELEFQKKMENIQNEHQETVHTMRIYYENELQKTIQTVLEENIYNSFTWRIGKLVLSPLKLIKKILCKLSLSKQH